MEEMAEADFAGSRVFALTVLRDDSPPLGDDGPGDALLEEKHLNNAPVGGGFCQRPSP